MSLRNDSAKRELLLTVLAHPVPMTFREMEAAITRQPSEIMEALDGLLAEFLLLQFSDGIHSTYGPNEIVVRTSRVLTRGLNALDRHIAEALAIRDGELKFKPRET